MVRLLPIVNLAQLGELMKMVPFLANLWKIVVAKVTVTLYNVQAYALNEKSEN